MFKFIEDIVDWLEKVTNKLKIKTFLLPVTQGCLIALEYANKYPSKIKKLILIGGLWNSSKKSLIDLALSGNLDLNLMMKWGYGSSKQFIEEIL